MQKWKVLVVGEALSLFLFPLNIREILRLKKNCASFNPMHMISPLFPHGNLTSVSLLMFLVVYWMQKTFQVSALGRSPKSLQSWEGKAFEA